MEKQLIAVYLICSFCSVLTFISVNAWYEIFQELKKKKE